MRLCLTLLNLLCRVRCGFSASTPDSVPNELCSTTVGPQYPGLPEAPGLHARIASLAQSWRSSLTDGTEHRRSREPWAYPVGRGHLDDDLDGRLAEVAAVAAHHHGAALAVAEVDGGEQALHEVGQVVALALKEARGPPQPPAARRPLVLVGRRLHRQHRDGVPLHSDARCRPAGRDSAAERRPHTGSRPAAGRREAVTSAPAARDRAPPTVGPRGTEAGRLAPRRPGGGGRRAQRGSRGGRGVAPPLPRPAEVRRSRAARRDARDLPEPCRQRAAAAAKNNPGKQHRESRSPARDVTGGWRRGRASAAHLLGGITLCQRRSRPRPPPPAAGAARFRTACRAAARREAARCGKRGKRSRAVSRAKETGS